jgi:arginine/ornithine transport system permease protein
VEHDLAHSSHVVQMIRHALPGFGNNWLVLLKTTALVSIIGLEDMVRRAGLAAGATRSPFTFYLTVAFIYLFLTTVSVLALQWAERRYSAGVRRA